MVILRKAILYLELIKFQHTVFALPFALLSAFLAAGGAPRLDKLGWILVAMVCARSAAMTFNRLMDAGYDRENPRTAMRHLPRGLVRRGEVWVLVLVSSAGLVFAAYALNPLAFKLSPVAVVIVFGYSLSKRFTSLSHFWLGLSLSIAPVGAWIAITGAFAMAPLWLALSVLLWTAGFDIIYACQDYEPDVRLGLFSIPSRMGIPRALKMAAGLHLLTVLVLGVFIHTAQLGWITWTGLALIALLLSYEHYLVRPDDLQRVNTAFFTINGIVSFGMLVAGLLDIFLA